MNIHELQDAFQREIATAGPVVRASDLPTRYEDLTVEWLTEALCGGDTGSAVTGFRLDRPDNGTSNRRRIFLEYNEAGEKAGLPVSVFCKSSMGLANRVIGLISGSIHNEISFYQNVRNELWIEAPICRYARVNEALNSLIIFDDIGRQVTFFGDRLAVDRDEAAQQMEILAQLHGHFLRSQATDSKLAAFPHWSSLFGHLEATFEQACAAGFEEAESVIPPRLFSRKAEVWPATLASVRAHSSLPETLCHGDVHLRNWYITHSKQMGLMDWQASSRGHWSRDLAYTISTSLTVEDRRRWERELLTYHSELMRAAGVRVDADALMGAYRQQLLSALAFWTVTLHPGAGMPDMQPRGVTLEFIRRIAQAIEDLDALDAF